MKNEEQMKRIGRSLQMQRERAGFKSAEAFAKEVGENPKTYTSYEQGARSIPIKKAFIYADTLGCTLDALCGRPAEEVKLDVYEQELIENYRACTQERQDRLIDTARDFAAMSKDAAKRDELSSPQVSA